MGSMEMIEASLQISKVDFNTYFGCSKTEGSLKTAYGLCQRMMHFFHQYLLYVTFEVLEPHWLALQTALKAANSLDEVILLHLNWSCYQFWNKSAIPL